MAPSTFHPKARREVAALLLALTAVALLMTGCERETKAEAPLPRPVRTVIAEKSELGQSVVLTGHLGGKRGCSRLSHWRPAFLSGWLASAIT